MGKGEEGTKDINRLGGESRERDGERNDERGRNDEEESTEGVWMRGG
jgi:hypothetical protein